MRESLADAAPPSARSTHACPVSGDLSKLHRHGEGVGFPSSTSAGDESGNVGGVDISKMTESATSDPRAIDSENQSLLTTATTTTTTSADLATEFLKYTNLDFLIRSFPETLQSLYLAPDGQTSVDAREMSPSPPLASPPFPESATISDQKYAEGSSSDLIGEATLRSVIPSLEELMLEHHELLAQPRSDSTQDNLLAMSLCDALTSATTVQPDTQRPSISLPSAADDPLLVNVEDEWSAAIESLWLQQRAAAGNDEDDDDAELKKSPPSNPRCSTGSSGGISSESPDSNSERGHGVVLWPFEERRRTQDHGSLGAKLGGAEGREALDEISRSILHESCLRGAEEQLLVTSPPPGLARRSSLGEVYSEKRTPQPRCAFLSGGSRLESAFARLSHAGTSGVEVPDLVADLGMEERSRVAVWASYVPPDSDGADSAALLAFRNSLSGDITRLMRVVNAPMSNHGLLIFSDLPAAIEFLRRAKSRQLELFDMLVAQEWPNAFTITSATPTASSAFSTAPGMPPQAAGLSPSLLRPTSPLTATATSATSLDPTTSSSSSGDPQHFIGDILLDPRTGSAIGFFLVNVSSRHPVCVHTLLRLSQHDAVALGHKRTSTETLRLLLTHPEVSPVMAVPPSQTFSSFPTSRATPVSQTPSHRRARIWCALCCKESVDIPSAWRHLSKNPHEALRSLLQADLLAWLESVYPRLARSLMLPSQHETYEVEDEKPGDEAAGIFGGMESAAELLSPSKTILPKSDTSSSRNAPAKAYEGRSRGGTSKYQQAGVSSASRVGSPGLFSPLPTVTAPTLPPLLEQKRASLMRQSEVASSSGESKDRDSAPCSHAPTGTLTPPEFLVFPSIHGQFPRANRPSSMLLGGSRTFRGAGGGRSTTPVGHTSPSRHWGGHLSHHLEDQEFIRHQGYTSTSLPQMMAEPDSYKVTGASHRSSSSGGILDSQGGLHVSAATRRGNAFLFSQESDSFAPGTSCRPAQENGAGDSALSGSAFLVEQMMRTVRRSEEREPPTSSFDDADGEAPEDFLGKPSGSPSTSTGSGLNPHASPFFPIGLTAGPQSLSASWT